jgi:hypothetical protein
MEARDTRDVRHKLQAMHATETFTRSSSCKRLVCKARTTCHSQHATPRDARSVLGAAWSSNLQRTTLPFAMGTMLKHRAAFLAHPSKRCGQIKVFGTSDIHNMVREICYHSCAQQATARNFCCVVGGAKPSIVPAPDAHVTIEQGESYRKCPIICSFNVRGSWFSCASATREPRSSILTALHLAHRLISLTLYQDQQHNKVHDLLVSCWQVGFVIGACGLPRHVWTMVSSQLLAIRELRSTGCSGRDHPPLPTTAHVPTRQIMCAGCHTTSATIQGRAGYLHRTFRGSVCAHVFGYTRALSLITG